MEPIGGPVLGLYGSRTEALGAESAWLMAVSPGNSPELLPILRRRHADQVAEQPREMALR